jgi:hypothetical protein
MKIILILVVLCLVSSAAVAGSVSLQSLSVGYGREENPPGCTSGVRTIDLGLGSDRLSLRLTDEMFSDGYNRQTLYAGKASSLTKLAVRVDSIDRDWLGANHVQPITDEFTLVIRPFWGLNDRTNDRLYVIGDYQPGGYWGAMLFFFADEGYKSDLYVGPTWREGNLALYVAPNAAKDGCTYWEVCLNIPIK